MRSHNEETNRQSTMDTLLRREVESLKKTYAVLLEEMDPARNLDLPEVTVDNLLSVRNRLERAYIETQHAVTLEFNARKQALELGEALDDLPVPDASIEAFIRRHHLGNIFKKFGVT